MAISFRFFGIFVALFVFSFAEAEGLEGVGATDRKFDAPPVSGCPITPAVEAFGNYVFGESVSTSACVSGDVFCVFDLYQSLQPPGITVTPGGYWMVYTDDGIFLDYIPADTACTDYSISGNSGVDHLVFTYFLDGEDCNSSEPSLTIYFNDDLYAGVEVTACAGIIDLMPFMPPGTPAGGVWTNYVEEWEAVFDCTPCALGTTIDVLYAYETDSGCPGEVAFTVTIGTPGIGGNIHNEKCGDGSVFDLASLLPDSVATGGVFSPVQEVVLLPQNSGTYTYAPSVAGCDNVVYNFSLNIIDSLSYTDLTTTLSEDGSSYTVSFLIEGGVPPYMVSGSQIVWPMFTSMPIPIDTPYIFELVDFSSCDDLIIIGSFESECGVSAGESPGEVSLCQTGSFCLFDLLVAADAGGVWTGPEGWTDAGCGLIEPFMAVPGDYIYTVSDDAGCVDTAIISLMAIDLGVVQTVTLCGAEADLDSLIENTGGVWMAPGYPQVLDTIIDGVINPTDHPSGAYTYVFYEAGCLTTLAVDVVFLPEVSAEVIFDSVTVCADIASFSPSVLIGVFDPAPAGSWIVYDSSGDFIANFPQWDVSFTGDELLEMGSALVFKYIQEASPCEPAVRSLPVYIIGGTTVVTDTVCQSEGYIDLHIYIPAWPIGGVWIDASGNVILGYIDLNNYAPGSVYVFYYISQLQGGCIETVEVWLTLSESLGAGEDYDIILCGTGEWIDLSDILPVNVDPGGTFSVPSVVAIPSNSGAYTYTLSEPECGNATATYHLTFTDLFAVEAVAECNPGGVTFGVVLEISGGMAPYVVNGEAIEGNIYEASGLAVANGEAWFVVADAGLCDGVEVVAGVVDADGDGICDDLQVLGCMDSLAANYNPLATNPGFCMYEADGPVDEVSTDPPFGGRPRGGGVGSSGGAGMSEVSMTVFPNPAVGEVYLDIAGFRSVAGVVEVVDVLGSVRYRADLAFANGGGLIKIDLAGFGSGVYPVRVFGGGEAVVGRVVVE